MKISSATPNQLVKLIIHCTVLACSGSLGCAPDESYELEEVARDDASLNKDCGSVPAQYIYKGVIAPALHTNAYGEGCQNNSIVVDVTNYDASYYSPMLTFDTLPNNQADCEAARLGYYVWEKTSSGFEYLGSRWRDGGTWSQERGCSIGLNSPIKLNGGKHYRLAVTARVNNQVRKLSIHSERLH